MSNPPTGLPDGTRLALRGRPDEAEAAAVIAAVDAARQADARAATPKRTPAWQRAARRESVGGKLVADPGDLR